jgi:uncharacterized caspase-like protein
MPFHDDPQAAVGGAPGERRVALVIGNSAYPTSPLKNPRNDAEAFAARLQAVHPAFDVTVALDVGRDAMEDALETFEARLGDCDTALLFFAGVAGSQSAQSGRDRSGARLPCRSAPGPRRRHA